MHRLYGLVASFAFVLSALTGCGGSDLVLPSDGTPAELVITGDGQSGSAGAALADSLEVTVRDSRGEPLPGQTVSFIVEPETPGAVVTPDVARTRSNGSARALWVLGATSGTQTVLARVDRGAGTEPLEARFTATVAPAAAKEIVAVEGNGQAGSASSPLPNQLVVLVTDEFGNPVSGVPVDWAAGAGSVEPTVSTTGADGRAGTVWTLGSETGEQSATAASGDLNGSPVTFTAVARAGSPNRLSRVSGDGQTASPGSALNEPLVVQLLDEAGNGVPNRAVSWVVATGGGSAAPESSTTDENGRASTRWTLGAAGRNTLNAVVSGVGVVEFTATASGGGGGGGGSTATRLEFRVQPSDTEERETMSPDVQVAVLDQAGNLVTAQDFPIKLELLDDRDRVRADGTVTTRSGVATFTIRISREGEYRLRASTDGLPSVESDRFKVEDD